MLSEQINAHKDKSGPDRGRGEKGSPEPWMPEFTEKARIKSAAHAHVSPLDDRGPLEGGQRNNQG